MFQSIPIYHNPKESLFANVLRMCNLLSNCLAFLVHLLVLSKHRPHSKPLIWWSFFLLRAELHQRRILWKLIHQENTSYPFHEVYHLDIPLCNMYLLHPLPLPLLPYLFRAVTSIWIIQAFSRLSEQQAEELAHSILLWLLFCLC